MRVKKISKFKQEKKFYPVVIRVNILMHFKDFFLCLFLFFILFYLFIFIDVQLIYKVELVSCVQQSDSVIHIYILFHILFYYGLLQDVEYSSLGHTVGPCCLSILYVVVCIC